GALGAAVVALVLVTGASGGQGVPDPLAEAAQGKLKPAKFETKTSSGQTVVRTMPFFSPALVDAAAQAACASRGVTSCDERAQGADKGSGFEPGADPRLGSAP